MKVKNLIKILQTLDGEENICVATEIDCYVYLYEQHIQKIYTENGYQGYIINALTYRYKGLTTVTGDEV